MNIEFIYQGNNYNFDLRKDITIKYIQDLASKLISKDTSSFDLLYKNDLLSEYKDSTLMKDLTKDDTNINIIIIKKGKNGFLLNEKLRQLKLRELDQNKNNINIIKLKSNLNTPLTISSINSKKKNSNQNLSLFHNKKNEYISENKVFEEVHNLKDNEIFSLMNYFSRKIKEYDNTLYKKYKNNNKSNSKELSLYEKNIFDFKDKQINFLKKLIGYFDNNEEDFNSGILPLTEFYNDLKAYNNPKKIIIYKNFDNNKNKELNNNNQNSNNNI